MATKAKPKNQPRRGTETLLVPLSTSILPKSGAETAADQREDDGNRQEADDELGETMPDFYGAHALAAGLRVHLGAPVQGHAEGGHADKHILDHLNRGGHLQGLRADERARRGHGARGVHGAADPGAAQHFRHAHPLDEGGASPPS